MNPLFLEIEDFYEKLQVGEFDEPLVLARILQAIDKYIERKQESYHPNQHSKELDINTRAWDELRKFRAMVEKWDMGTNFKAWDK